MDRRYILAILAVGFIDVIAAVGGPLIDTVFDVGDAPLSIAYGIAAVVTFLGLLPIAIDREKAGGFGFRELIASVFIIIFFLLLTSEAFFHVNLPEGNLTPQLVSNFTTLTGVVVGAYFGVTALEKVSDSRSRRTVETKTHADDHDDSTEALHGILSFARALLQNFSIARNSLASLARTQ